MMMDLQNLHMAYNNAVRQIAALDTCHSELILRREQAFLNNLTSEFNYADFKLETLKAVRCMYEEYRDDKWKQLQQESTHDLQEVLNSHHDNHYEAMPLSPPLSPSDDTGIMQTRDQTGRDEDIHIHMIPSPLTPIDDIDDVMLTPPSSPRAQDRFYYARNLTVPMFGELSRDF